MYSKKARNIFLFKTSCQKASAVPLPCFIDVKSQTVAGQRPQQGTNSCRMGRNSIRPSVRTSTPPSFGWSTHPLSKGSEGQLEGSEGLLEGSEGLPEWSEGLPDGSEGLSNGSEARPQGILTGLPSLSAFSHVGCSQESIHRGYFLGTITREHQFFI